MGPKDQAQGNSLCFMHGPQSWISLFMKGQGHAFVASVKNQACWMKKAGGGRGVFEDSDGSKEYLLAFSGQEYDKNNVEGDEYM